jgi:hypothetical protein
MADGVQRSDRKIKAITRKPIIVIELATNTGARGKPDWIRNGYPAVYARFPGIKGVSYLNVDLRRIGHPDWSLDQGPVEVALGRSFPGHTQPFRADLPR